MSDRELCEKAAEVLGLEFRTRDPEDDCGWEELAIAFPSSIHPFHCWVPFPPDSHRLDLKLAFVGRVAEAMDAVVGIAPPVRGHTDYEVCIHADAPMHGTDKNPARAALKAVIA